MKVEKLRLGLVGKDVSKSDSERIHRFILNELGVACEYERFSVDKENFDSVMRRLLGDFDAFNVTIPYKRDVMGYLDEITGDALEYGAVNTVINAESRGYNTDGVGFLLMLRNAGVEFKDKKILVLGAGGSGRSSAVALKKAGGKVYIYQRNQEKLQETCKALQLTPATDAEEGGYDIVINCTGVGMHDTEGRSPVTKNAFTGAEWAVDLIYVPRKPKFLQLAEECGVKTLNGAAMLFYQGYFADCLFLGLTPDDAQAKDLYEKYLEKYND